MEWISIKDRLPENNLAVRVKFEHPDCKDNCLGYAFYIQGRWVGILAMLCAGHRLTSKSEKTNDNRIAKQITYWRPLIEKIDYYQYLGLGSK